MTKLATRHMKYWTPKAWIGWAVDRIRYRSPGSSDAARECLMDLLDPDAEKVRERKSVIALINAMERFCHTLKSSREYHSLVHAEREAEANTRWEAFYRRLGLDDNLSLTTEKPGGDTFGTGPRLNPNISRSTGEDLS